MRSHPASLPAPFTLLFRAAFGAAVLGDRVSAQLLVALILVAGGIYLVNRNPSEMPAQRRFLKALSDAEGSRTNADARC